MATSNLKVKIYISKVGDYYRWGPEGPFFNSYYS